MKKKLLKELFIKRCAVDINHLPYMIKDGQEHYSIIYQLIMKNTDSKREFVNKLDEIIKDINKIDNSFISLIRRNNDINEGINIGIQIMSNLKTPQYFKTKQYKNIHKILRNNFYVNESCKINFLIQDNDIVEPRLLGRFREMIQKIKEYELLEKIFNQKYYYFTNYYIFAQTYTTRIPGENIWSPIISHGEKIEFRIFGGTLNYKKLLKYIDFIYAITKGKDFNSDYYIKYLSSNN